MIKLFTSKVSFLKSVESNVGECQTLKEMLLGEEWKEQVERARNATTEEEYKAVKRTLPCFTASGLFRNPINAQNLSEHSGFICIDIDEKDNTEVTDFAQLKEKIHEVPHVAYCGYSVGGKGFFCLIPIKDPTKHRAYFRALQRDFKQCGITIDPSCCDVSRKRIVSYDPVPYINTHAEVYDFVIREYENLRKGVEVMTDEQTKGKVCELMDTICREKIDITADRSAWFEVLCSIASYFGEEGREYVHRVCQFYPGYSVEETDNKFNDVLAHGGYGYTIATLFYHANNVINSASFEFRGMFPYDDNI